MHVGYRLSWRQIITLTISTLSQLDHGNVVFKWNLIRHANIFLHEDAFEFAIDEISVIFFRTPCGKYYLVIV